jgi:hypothetical protein
MSLSEQLGHPGPNVTIYTPPLPSPAVELGDDPADPGIAAFEVIDDELVPLDYDDGPEPDGYTGPRLAIDDAIEVWHAVRDGQTRRMLVSLAAEHPQAARRLIDLTRRAGHSVRLPTDPTTLEMIFPETNGALEMSYPTDPAGRTTDHHPTPQRSVNLSQPDGPRTNEQQLNDYRRNWTANWVPSAAATRTDAYTAAPDPGRAEREAFLEHVKESPFHDLQMRRTASGDNFTRATPTRAPIIPRHANGQPILGMDAQPLFEGAPQSGERIYIDSDDPRLTAARAVIARGRKHFDYGRGRLD